MVRLEQVNKYFNKRKKNEIHVINDTSLEIGQTGLVALLGPSGCGKTTLLNAIGGLDKVSKGRIYINGQKITRRRSGKVDQIRNLNIGYIFQNYNLVDNMTVFDNVALALKMVGVKDKREIEEKVNYVLEKVGMYRYRNRYADMLSGGERQRVGIARAIVKNPAIIIADEPTGNLDSKNTLEVMNIIRSISQDRLVILVTHEEKLADFYATRIIRILDGQVVSDEENKHDNDLDYRLENKIYLKDIKDHKRLKTDLYNIDFYNDSSTPLKLDIVVRNGNIYIRTSEKGGERLEVVDDNSSIEMVDEHYREMTREESLENSFDLDKLASKGRRRYTSILNPFTMIRNGFKTVFGYSMIKKILLFGFLVCAMFVTYGVSNIFGVLHITDDQFVTADKSYLTIVSKNVSVKSYQKYEKDDQFSYIMPGDARVSMAVPYDEYFQTQSYMAPYLSGSLSDAGKLTESDIVYGRLPEKKTEIAVDKKVLKNLIDEYMLKMVGLGTPKDFLEKTVTVTNMPDMKIVGVTDFQSPCVYTDQRLFINLLANAVSAEDGMEGMDMSGEGDSEALLDYKLKKKDVQLKKGSWPKKDYEVLVNETNKEEMPLNKEIDQKVNGQKLKVVGYYKDGENSSFMLVNNNTIKYNLINNLSNITACPVDKDASISYLQEEKVNVKDIYADSRKEYKAEIRDSVRSAIIMAAVVLAISFIEIFLIIRASFLSRVKEVGVYRAIGVKKSDIYKMFLGEILAITTMASMPGFLFMAYILKKLTGFSVFAEMFQVTPIVLGLTVILLYGFNLVFGLLPVFRTMRKRPAAILSRTDVN